MSLNHTRLTDIVNLVLKGALIAVYWLIQYGAQYNCNYIEWVKNEESLEYLMTRLKGHV